MNDTQRRLLNILGKLDIVCKRHGIRYACEGGSLLGAIRCEGFLPWDDDMDVAMERSEFERLLDVADEFHEFDMDLVCIQRYPEYHKSTIKLCDLTTSCILQSHLCHGLACGQHIDIFLLDPVPAGKEDEFLAYYSVYEEIKNPYYLVNPVVGKYAGLFNEYYEMYLREGRAATIAELEERIFRYDAADCDRYHFRWGERQFFVSKSTFDGPLPEVPFEDRTFPIMPGYPLYLREDFGDSWKEVPLPKDRESHSTMLNYGLSSNNVHDDFLAHVNREELELAFLRRKAGQVARLPYDEGIKRARAEARARIDGRFFIAPLAESGRFAAALEAREYSAAYALVAPLLENTGEFCRRGVLPQAAQGFWLQVVEACVRNGHFFYGEPILGALEGRAAETGEASASDLALWRDRIEASRALMAAFDDARAGVGEFGEVERILNGHPEMLNGFADFTATQLQLLLRDPQARLGAEARERVEAQLAMFPENGKLLKVAADCFARDGEAECARVRGMYEKAATCTRDGLILLALKKEQGIDAYALEAAALESSDR